MKELLQLFIVFFKIGAFTFGGGYAMLPLIQKEVVEVRKWASNEEIVDIFAIAQTLPGIIAINTAIYIGYRVKGLKGSIASALGVILPSFITILSLVWVLVSIKDDPYVKKAFTGVRAGVMVMIGISAYKLGKNIIKNKLSAIVGIFSFLAIGVADIPTVIVLIIAIALGCLLYPMQILFKKKNKTRIIKGDEP